MSVFAEARLLRILQRRTAPRATWPTEHCFAASHVRSSSWTLGADPWVGPVAAVAPPVRWVAESRQIAIFVPMILYCSRVTVAVRDGW
jgi:hypothetical protein